MEDTIRIYVDNEMETIPFVCIDNMIQLKRPKLEQRMEVGEYELIALMSVTAASELWYGKDFYGQRVVVKVTNQFPDMELIQKIRSVYCENLVPILDCGYYREYWYEVYPYYKNGHLDGRFGIEEIKKIILPGLIQSLNVLHDNKIIHNDIKPENIFWDESREKILLGDFGCATQENERAKSFTPAYAAPELLLNDVSRKTSDWASVGLLLATLLEGKPLISAKTVSDARNIWERGVFFKNEDSVVQRLIGGMIHMDPLKRFGPNAANKWCGNITFGGEQRSSVKREIVQAPVTIEFSNPPWVAVDIESLIKGIELHWEHSVFLFQQSRFDRFLSQFDKEWVNVCKTYRKMANAEDALFRLTLDLNKNREFVWRGKKYNHLLEMEERWEQNSTGEADIVAFLQRGHVVYYLEKQNVASEQSEYAKRLQDICRIHPAEACLQLFQALRGNDGMEWEGEIFEDLHDLVRWMASCTHTLDKEIDKMFKSRRFEAWLVYHGFENVLEEIRRKCET